MLDRPASCERSALPLGFLEMRKAIHRMLTGGYRADDMATNYDFGAASAFSEDYKTVPARTVEYSGIWRTFETSMDRVRSLGLMPIDLLAWANLSTIATCAARHRHGYDPIDYSHDNAPGFRELCEQAFEEIRPRDTQIGRMISAQNLSRFRDADAGPSALVIGSALDSILAAMITAAYAAFETMAEDLWGAALDKYDDLAISYRDRMLKGKKADWETLTGHTLNLSGKMGSMLLQKKVVTFNSFNEIRNEYKGTFRTCVETVFADVDDIIETQEVRHLIAHRGGMIDATFHEKMVELGASDYKDLPAGTQIPFTGGLTRRHIDACVGIGVALFSAVDSWSA